MLKQHLEIFRRLLFISYLCCVVLSFQAALYIESNFAFPDTPFALFDNLMLAALIIWGIVLWNQKDCYLFRSRSRLEVMRTITSASLKAAGLYMLFLFFSEYSFQSKLQIGIFMVLNTLALNGLQLSILYVLEYYRRRGFNYQTVLVVGRGRKARDFVDKTFKNAHWGYKVTGFVDWQSIGQAQLWSYRDIPRIGSLDDLPELIKTRQVDWVVFTVENGELKLIEPAVDICQEMGTRVVVLADFFPGRYSNKRLEEFFEFPSLLFDNAPPRKFEYLLKTVFDRIAAATGLILAVPIMFFAALAIKFSSNGPILFKQERIGLNGKKFIMYKFRTMVPNAEKLKSFLEKHNEMDGPVFKIEKDPRVTSIGGFLRKASIDELPQLFNVLKGDMSLVGPRPPLSNEVKQYDPWQRRRLSMKPGITCLWQINGRNKVGFKKWMEMDLQYIDNWSLWLDTKILAGTIPSVLTGKGAH